MNQQTTLVVFLVFMCLQLILGQNSNQKVKCYTQYCEKNEETKEWECETSESRTSECEVNNVCMETQLPSTELFIQQGCKFENFIDDDDDKKIRNGEMICDEGYCYCKTNLCNNKNFKMPDKYTVKEQKAG